MTYPAHKPVHALQQSDIQWLVDAAAQESETVEFKRDFWGQSDEERRKMLRSIVSLANQRGGELYVGIEEKDGTAVGLVGVEGEGLIERVTQSCRANVERPLRLEAAAVALASGRSVIVLRVPLSLSGPHMITFKGLNQFWIRHGRTKAPMTVDEVEAAFMGRFEGETHVERMRAQQQIRDAKDAGPRLWTAISATPVFFTRTVIDTRDPRLRALLQQPPLYSGLPGGDVLGSGQPRASLAGVSRDDIYEETLHSRLEVHRNGHIHFAEAADFIDAGSPEKIVPGASVALVVHDFVHLVRDIYKIGPIGGPVAFYLTLLNVSGSVLDTGRRVLYRRQSSVFDRPVLALPASYADDVDADLGRVIAELNDWLWNAYRLEACPYFTEEGQLDVRRLK